MRLILFVLCAALVPPLLFAATVYKCTDSSGRTIFSDKECGPVVEMIEYTHPESYYEKTMREHEESKQRSAETEARRAAEKVVRERQVSEVRRKHDAMCTARKAESGLVIGMSKASILGHDLWGYPDDLTKTTTQNGVKEYLVYKCDGHPSVRLFVTNGKLTSIHN